MTMTKLDNHDRSGKCLGLLPPGMSQRLPPIIAAVLLVPACFSPKIADGDFRCGDNDACPSGFVCASDKFCRPSDGTSDGPTSPPDGVVELTPSNIDAALVRKGMATLRPNVSIIIDTDRGQILPLDGGQPIDVADLVVTHVPQLSPTLAVFSVREFEIPSAVVIKGRGSQALVFAVRDRVVIDGTIDVGAELATPGPGGFPGVTTTVPGAGPGGGQTCGQFGTLCGGGGAGYLAKGGDGAAGTPTRSSSRGGIAAGSTKLIPLLGGSSGGGGDGGDGGITQSGAGGGAIQITTFGDITVSSTGIITAGGGGGNGGSSRKGGGSGGGSGGAILLEANRIEIAGVLAANGGSGGGGSCTTAGKPGRSGSAGAAAALGGAAGDGLSTKGGDGGAGVSAAGASAEGSATCGGGGGGGAGGRIHLRGRGTMVSNAKTLSPQAVSLEAP